MFIVIDALFVMEFSINWRVFAKNVNQHSILRLREFSSKGVVRFVMLGSQLSSWGGMGFVVELEDLLGCKVDVATVEELKPRIRERVLREAIPL